MRGATAQMPTVEVWEQRYNGLNGRTGAIHSEEVAGWASASSNSRAGSHGPCSARGAAGRPAGGRHCASPRKAKHSRKAALPPRMGEEAWAGMTRSHPSRASSASTQARPCSGTASKTTRVMGPNRSHTPTCGAGGGAAGACTCNTTGERSAEDGSDAGGVAQWTRGQGYCLWAPSRGAAGRAVSCHGQARPELRRSCAAPAPRQPWPQPCTDASRGSPSLLHRCWPGSGGSTPRRPCRSLRGGSAHVLGWMQRTKTACLAERTWRLLMHGRGRATSNLETGPPAGPSAQAAVQAAHCESCSASRAAHPCRRAAAPRAGAAPRRPR